jgi:prepilin-type processing-associated H-X9-DG protein
VRNYAMNAHVGWRDPLYRNKPDPAYRVYLKTDAMVHPSPADLLVFMEVHPESICRPFFGAYMGENRIYHFPGSHHGRSGVFSFADGHVESRKWLNSGIFDPQVLDFHRHNFAQPWAANPDIAWIHSRTTVRRR